MSKINHPDHYADSCSLECIEVMRIAFGEEAVNYFALLSAFKYMWRHKAKDGVDDLKKAEWFLDYIHEEYGAPAQYDEKVSEMQELLEKLMEEEEDE